MIPYTKAHVTLEDIKLISKASKDGWGKNHSKYINLFSQRFKKIHNIKFCIPTSSCTGALHIGLMSLGLNAGDEIILSDTNWIAPAAIIKVLNLKPVFADINMKTWCIDPNDVEKKITKKTKAIIITHLYGNLCDIPAFKKIYKKYKIPIFEDAAEALGSKFNNKLSGTFFHSGYFSFHGTKTITTGEGGAIITNNENFYKKALLISNQGRDLKNYSNFSPVEIGLKYKMSNLQGALGFSQLKRINKIIKKKIYIFKRYKKNLKEYKDIIQMNYADRFNQNSYWMPTIVLNINNINYEIVKDYFKKNNIDIRPFFRPLSSLRMFAKTKNENSYNIFSRSFNLPSYNEMRDDHIDKVSKVLINFIKINEKKKNQ